MCSSAGQWLLQRNVKQQLAELEPLARIAQEQEQRYAELRREVAKKEETADLFAYLRHPWPRSQVIAAIAEAVPPEIELSSFHLFVEQKTVSVSEAASRQRPQANSEPEKKLPPRTQDLADLRESLDGSQTVVEVQGSTIDDAQLHAYVQALTEHPLLVSAQLVSLSAVENPGGMRTSAFSLKIQVSPGYGQPGGPEIVRQPVAPPSEAAPAEAVEPDKNASLEPSAAEVKS